MEKNVFDSIAKNQGVSRAEVENEIAYAIGGAMKSDDPKAKEIWGKISPDGKAPTPEDFIGILAKMVAERLKE